LDPFEKEKEKIMTIGPVVYRQVYYVESPDDDSLNPIAVRPCFKPGNVLLWEDTGRGTMRKVTQVSVSSEKTKDGSECPVQFSVITDKEERITFTLMDVKLYNAKVKDRVWGKLDFKSDAELRDFYLKHSFSV
jgi:hypothetical protein